MQKITTLEEIKLAKAFAQAMASAGLIVKGSKSEYTNMLMEAK